MNAETLKSAIAHGAARVRRLSGCHVLISVADQGFAAVLLNPTPEPIFDFSACGRLSKGAAHRVVNSMLDAPKPLKQFYHDLIDGRPCGKEVAE